MKNIIENVTIINKNGLKKIYGAIKITKKGVYIGSIIIKNKEGEVFVDNGFIPSDQIQKITFSDEHGKSKDIDL